MGNDLLRNDLEILLKDITVDSTVYKYLSSSVWRKNNFVELNNFKDFLYKRYNRSDLYNYINYQSKNLIPDYLEIIKQLEKKENQSSWYCKQVFERGSVLLQQGFTEKIFDTYRYNPNINQSLVSEKGIISFDKPYYYQDTNWFWILGDDFPVISNDELFRFYFNLDGANFEGISILIRFLINEFDCRNISYKLKLPINEQFFGRADNVVLYIDKFHFSITVELIYKLNYLLHPFLRKEIPLFTRFITKGIAFSEEPHDENNQSFGENRINTILEAIKGLSIKTKTTGVDLIDRIIKKLNDKGDDENFYLNAKSVYKELATKDEFYPPDLNFDFDNFLFDNPLFQSKNAQNFYSKDIHQNAIIKIAYQLCSSAIIYAQSSLLWLRGEEVEDEGKKIVVVGVGDDYHKGRLGIAFFLLKVFEYYRDPLFFNIVSRIVWTIANKPDIETEELYFLFEFTKISNRNLNSVELVLSPFSTASLRCNDEVKKSLDKLFSEPFTTNKNTVKEIIWITDILIKYKNSSKEYPQLFGSYHEKVLQRYTEMLKNIDSFKDDVYSKKDVFNLQGCICCKIIEFILNVGIEGDSLILESVKKLRGLLEKNELSSNIRTQSIYILANLLNHKINRFDNTSYAFEKDLLKELTDSVNRFSQNFVINNIKNHSLIGDLADINLMLSYLQNPKVLDNKYGSKLLVENLIQNYLDKVITNVLDKDIFPPLTLGTEFYNPGIVDGIAGLGFLILKFMRVKEMSKTLYSLESVELPIQSYYFVVEPIQLQLLQKSP